MRSLSRPSLRQRTSRSSPSPLWAYRGSFQASGRIRAVRSARIVLLLTSSRPEEFHLRALPEPCMTLSSHTAPDVRPLLERLCLVHRLLLFPVGQWPRPNNAAPSLQPHYRAFDATTGDEIFDRLAARRGFSRKGRATDRDPCKTASIPATTGGLTSVGRLFYACRSGSAALGSDFARSCAFSEPPRTTRLA